jgi:FkbM family methyltransferase
MTVEADIEQDRYQIASLPRKGGLYIDIGAHIGTWLVAALLDDEEATAIAVEPLLTNCEAITDHAALNGLSRRLGVVHRAAFAKRGPVSIAWDFHSEEDPERARMHRYIGGFNLDLMPDDVTYQTERAKVITPAKLLTEDVAVLKVAGETSERALIGAKLERVELIIGKYHSELPDLVPWLRKTHDVGVLGSPSFGWYRAERLPG